MENNYPNRSFKDNDPYNFNTYIEYKDHDLKIFINKFYTSSWFNKGYDGIKLDISNLRSMSLCFFGHLRI